MLDRPTNQKIIINSLIWGIVVAVIIAMVLLVLGASSVSGNVTREVTKVISVGPIELFSVAKKPVTDGYQGSFAFKPGLIIFIVLITGLGAGIGYLRAQKLEQHTKKAKA